MNLRNVLEVGLSPGSGPVSGSLFPATGCPNSWRCDQLRQRIHETHLCYLNMEETPEKLEHRTRLEGLIVEFLSLVPDGHKFGQIEVSNCLKASLADKSDLQMSFFKAGLAYDSFEDEHKIYPSVQAIARAFGVLEKFATNLLTHPWRKEYQVICTFSGFYKHAIDKQLKGAKQILESIGYRKSSIKGILRLLETPVDPDKLAKLTLDCLVAFVECQMMIQIQEALKVKGINASSSEIYGIRTEYVSGMDDVVRLLVELKRPVDLLNCEERVPSLSSKYSGNNSRRASQLDRLPQTNGSLPLYDEPYSLSMPKKSGRSTSSETNCYDEELSANESFDLMHFPLVNNSNHHQHQSRGYPVPPPRYYSLHAPAPHPMAFIAPPPAMFANEVPPPLQCLENYHNHEFEFKPMPMTGSKSSQAGPAVESVTNSLGRLSFKKSNSPKPDGTVSLNRKNKSSSPGSSSSTSRGGHEESLKLRRKGSFYDNIHTSQETQTESQKTFAPENTSGSSYRRASSLEKRKKSQSKSSPGSRTNPAPEQTIAPAPPPVKPSGREETPKEEPHYSLDAPLSVAVPEVSTSRRVSRSAGTDKDKDTEQGGSGKWPCMTCTYLNARSSEICEMCARSRERGSEEQPLESGGKECFRCTLVNERSAAFCTACEASLADSPTYI